MRVAKSLVAIGEIELMSMTILPGFRPSATPSAPNSTASTSGVSGTMTMTTSERSATSFADAHARARDRQLGRDGRAVEQAELMPGVDEMARHGPAHDAEADESDFRHGVLPDVLPTVRRRGAREPAEAFGVVVLGLYSQPIQPS